LSAAAFALVCFFLRSVFSSSRIACKRLICLSAANLGKGYSSSLFKVMVRPVEQSHELPNLTQRKADFLQLLDGARNVDALRRIVVIALGAITSGPLQQSASLVVSNLRTLQCLCRPRRTLRLRGVPGLGFRLSALSLRLIERRGVTFGRLRPRLFGLRIPASGLKGGVGKTIPPSLRPWLLP
jgi:hypothetical protein